MGTIGNGITLTGSSFKITPYISTPAPTTAPTPAPTTAPTPAPTTPQVITTGLALNLDAGTYSGTGSTWTDTIANKVFTLYNSPAYSAANGGYFTFNGSSQYAFASSGITGTNTGFANWTVEAWFYYTGTSQQYGAIMSDQYTNASYGMNFMLGGIGPGGGGSISSTSQNMAAGSYYQGSFRSTSTSYQIPTANAWYQIVGTSTGPASNQYTWNLYTNTTLQQTYTDPSTNLTPGSSNSGTFVMVNYGSSAYMAGRLSVLRVYNRALNQTEITQNYNAVKSRFGL